jgi:hypothetical protein
MGEEAEDAGKRNNGLWKAGGAVLLAVLTGAVSYAYGVAEDVRKTRLVFVDAQIERLYGPLYAGTQAADAVWDLFYKQHWRGRRNARDDIAFFDDGQPPTVEQARRWRVWMRTVFQPINKAMVDTVTANTQFVVGDTIPKPVRDLIAHTRSYDAVMAMWKDDDFDGCPPAVEGPGALSSCPQLASLRNTSGLNYPEAVIACVQDDYERLKRLQRDLRGSLAFTAPFIDTALRRSPRCGA